MRYSVVAANLHREGIADADRIATILRDEGWPRATRSLVIREALDLLKEHLADKLPDDIFRYFIVRLGKRVALRTPADNGTRSAGLTTAQPESTATPSQSTSATTTSA